MCKYLHPGAGASFAFINLYALLSSQAIALDRILNRKWVINFNM